MIDQAAWELSIGGYNPDARIAPELGMMVAFYGILFRYQEDVAGQVSEWVLMKIVMIWQRQRGLQSQSLSNQRIEKALGVANACSSNDLQSSEILEGASLLRIAQLPSGAVDEARDPLPGFRLRGLFRIVDQGDVPWAGHRFAQRSRWKQKTISPHAAIEDHDLDVLAAGIGGLTGKWVMLQAVVANQDIAFRMLGQQGPCTGGTIRVDPDGNGQ